MYLEEVRWKRKEGSVEWKGTAFRTLEGKEQERRRETGEVTEMRKEEERRSGECERKVSGREERV